MDKEKMECKDKTKIETLLIQIDDKKEQIEKLNSEIESLKNNVELLKSEQYCKMLEKANNLLNKYYLYFIPQFEVFYFCYCNNVLENQCCAEVSYFDFVIKRNSGTISYDEDETSMIMYESYFDNVLVLNSEQAKMIQDKINKATIHHKQTIKDLYDDLYEFFKLKMLEFD